MSWITIIWSMNAAVFLTLAGIHLTVWLNSRKLWGHLLFSCSAVAGAGVAAGELLMMRSETVEQCGMVMRWTQVPLWLLVVSIVGFTRFHLRAGRPWLAWATVGMRTVVLVLNFLATPNINFQAITHLNRIPFLREFISLPQGTAHPLEIVAWLSTLLLLVFLVNASVEVWRRGERRRAVMLGGSMIFFITVAAVHFALLERGIIQTPYIISLAYLGTIWVMAYELSREVLRAVQIERELRQSEADLRASETQLLKSRSELKDQLAFERLGTDISSTLMRVPAEELGKQIVPAMGQVAQFLGYDASTLAMFTGNDTKALIPYVWTAPDTSGLPTNLTDKDFPWSAQELIAGRDVHVRTLDDFPPEAQTDRATYERYGLKSALDVPIVVSGQIMGVFSLGSFRTERSVPPQLVERQRVLGSVFCHAIVRARSELALRESEKKLALAATAGDLGLWLWNLQTNSLWATERTKEIFGFPPEGDLTYEMFYARLHPADRPAVEMRIAGAISSKSNYEIEYRICMADGTEKWIAARGEVAFENGDRPASMTGIVADITERRRNALELFRHRQELAHLSRVTMLGELSGSLAHELNQPLTAILSNAQAAQRFLAQDKVDLVELREILGDIVAEDKRAGEVIHRLRLLLKKGEVQRQPVNVNELVLEVLKLVRNDLVNQGVTAQTGLAPDLPVILGDRIQFQQVMLNLILNACDAMSGMAAAERQVHVRTRQTATRNVEISIGDCGRGVAADKLEQIFEPFFTTKANGMGLGLSVCRTIINAHGGKLWAENNPERGATFCFALPFNPGEGA